MLDSHIGYGAPHKHDTAEAHGEPLGEEEVRAAKRNYGWPEDAQFLVPAEVYEDFARGVGARGAEAHRSWLEKLAAYRSAYPALAAEIDQMQHRELPQGWDRDLPVYAADQKGIAGRDASGAALNAIARNVPWFLGGSADLGTSNRTTLKFTGAGDFQATNPRRPEFAFRDPRARYGCDLQRTCAIEAAAFRSDIFHLQRLCASGFAACRIDGTAGDFRFHP